MATLSGRIAITDPNSTWTLNVNWGNGSPVQTFVFGPGSNGRKVALRHRYLKAGSAGHHHQIVAQWQDNQGRGNTELFQVKVRASR